MDEKNKMRPFFSQKLLGGGNKVETWSWVKERETGAGKET